MAKAIFINGNRQGYGPDQIEHQTMTVGELIAVLEEMMLEQGEDAKVFICNDNGYTYGSIGYYGDVFGGEYTEDSVTLRNDEF